MELVEEMLAEAGAARNPEYRMDAVHTYQTSVIGGESSENEGQKDGNIEKGGWARNTANNPRIKKND